MQRVKAKISNMYKTHRGNYYADLSFKHMMTTENLTIEEFTALIPGDTIIIETYYHQNDFIVRTPRPIQKVIEHKDTYVSV